MFALDRRNEHLFSSSEMRMLTILLMLRSQKNLIKFYSNKENLSNNFLTINRLIMNFCSPSTDAYILNFCHASSDIVIDVTDGYMQGRLLHCYAIFGEVKYR